MATSSLIQFLEAGEAGDTSNRSTSETYLAGGAITLGDWVAFDTSQSGADRALYVIEAAGVATVGNSAAFGVAKATVAAGDWVEVYIGGYCPVASVAAATVAGSPLIGPIGTAGRAEIEVPATTTGQLCATALEADTANFAAVFIHRKV